MEIYAFHTYYNRIWDLVCAAVLLVVLILSVRIIRSSVLQCKMYRKAQRKIPVRFALLTSVALIVLSVVGFAVGGLLVDSLAYTFAMKKDEGQYLIGDVTILSCEECRYRGEFMGYDVVIEMGGQIMAPANSFPKDVIDAFEREQELIIQYGEIKGDGLYVWSIKTAQEE